MGYWYFPRAAPRPKPVAGKRGKRFGFTWWGQKWLESVESKGAEQRMARGRAYARADRVFNIKLDCGKVTAKVEGSENYNVNIKFPVHNTEKWSKALELICSNEEALGALLNNELPQNIEKTCKLKFIPKNLDAKCSCPDWENPCKHIAAVYYVLADEIDQAPQILFTLSGIKQKQLAEALTGKKEEKRTEKPGRSGKRRSLARPTSTPKKRTSDTSTRRKNN